MAAISSTIRKQNRPQPFEFWTCSVFQPLLYLNYSIKLGGRMFHFQAVICIMETQSSIQASDLNIPRLDTRIWISRHWLKSGPKMHTLAILLDQYLNDILWMIFQGNYAKILPTFCHEKLNRKRLLAANVVGFTLPKIIV